jgi:hypothetical protein
LKNDHWFAITSTHGETPYAIVKLTPNDLEPKDWEFLREWANNLGVSLEELLKRILVAAVIGQLYAESFLKFETASRVCPDTHEARSVGVCDLTTE